MFEDIKRAIKKLRRKSRRLYRSGWSNNTPAMSSGGIATAMTWYTGSDEVSSSSKRKEKKDTRIEKKPVEVFKEILSKKPKINLDEIDDQIKLVTRRKQVLEDVGVQTSDEVEALKFLEARKRLKKHKDKFGWETTTFQKIEDLCKKYKLKMVSFSSYYKCVPMEAIDELEKFVDAYACVRNDEPVLKLIIDEGGKETKKDPILLASSPFGKWFFVLGAWDKEVEIVDDLIYKGK